MRRLLNLSDTELIEHLQMGHGKAFDVLIQRYEKDLRNVIYHYVKDWLLTDDLSQDVLIKIYTSLKQNKYNERGKFLPWALRIARNLCLDYLRKAAQVPRTSAIPHHDCLCTTAGQSAEGRLIARQQEQQLSVFINRLPHDQKQVVCYRIFEQRSYKEIAVRMNTSVNTSLARMRYGLTHLRKQVTNTPLCLWR